VVLAVRDETKGRTAAAAMPGTTEVWPLDLASLASAASCQARRVPCAVSAVSMSVR